jgi:hypothetical protein
MKLERYLSFCLLFHCLSPLLAQHRVDLRNTYERIYAVVPMIGAGTAEDPRRPMFVPAPGEKPSRDGIIAFTYQLSDDGNTALVEFVARDRAALAPILNERASRADVKIFEKGKDTRRNIEAEFRRHKRDFDLDRFGVNVP